MMIEEKNVLKNQEEKKVFLVKETPIVLSYGDVQTTFLASAEDIEALIAGHLLTQGVIKQISDILAIQIQKKEDVILVDAKLRYVQKKKGLLSWIEKPPMIVENASFPIANLLEGFSQMEKHQVLREKTGASHAVSFLTEKGEMPFLCEDVGRHNALDKLIAHLAQEHLKKGAILTTSRASFEMVQKCLVAGVPILAAISAPSALAVQVANRSNLTLLGFVRKNSYTIYTHSTRIRF